MQCVGGTQTVTFFCVSIYMLWSDGRLQKDNIKTLSLFSLRNPCLKENYMLCTVYRKVDTFFKCIALHFFILNGETVCLYCLCEIYSCFLESYYVSGFVFCITDWEFRFPFPFPTFLQTKSLLSLRTVHWNKLNKLKLKWTTVHLDPGKDFRFLCVCL